MTDAYKIGVTVAMTNLVGVELAKIIRDLTTAQHGADGLKMSFAKLGAVGVTGAIAAVGLALKAGVEEARRFQIEATKFAALGFGDQTNQQAQRFAEGMKTIGTSATENMSLVADAMAVFKSLPHAEMAAPIMAQMKFANAAVYGEEGGARDSKFMDMMKVIEFRGGLKNDDEFHTQADFVQKVINGSRNRVDATKLLDALKTGGVALAGMQNDAFYLGSEPMIQEFGGQRYGSGMSAAYQNLVQMRSSQKALTEMMRLGLLDPDKIKQNRFTGQVASAQAGAFRGGDVLTSEGMLAFIEKVLLPAFASKGITSDAAISNEFATIMGNPRGANLAVRTYQQRAQLHTQIDANRSAMNVSQLAKAADGTLDGKILELSAEWKKLENQMGVLLPFVTKVTGWLVSIVKALQLDSSFSGSVGGFVNGRLAEDKAIWNGVKGTVGSLFSSSASPVPPPPAPKNMTVNVELKGDMRTIANGVSRIQIDGIAGQSLGGSAVDFGLSPVPVH